MTKAAGIAWLINFVYYFYPDTLRLAPAVMMPHESDQTAFQPLLYGVGRALLLTIVLKETGAAARAKAPVVEVSP